MFTASELQVLSLTFRAFAGSACWCLRFVRLSVTVWWKERTESWGGIKACGVVENGMAQGKARTMWVGGLGGVGGQVTDCGEELGCSPPPSVTYTGSSATANMTSRAGASVSPPATSLRLPRPPESQLFSSSSSSSLSLTSYRAYYLLNLLKQRQ